MHSPLSFNRKGVFGLLIAISLLGGSFMQAATITSSNFSIAYGFTSPNPGNWNTSENSSVNSPTTQGNFSFTPSLTNTGTSFWGSSGPSFVNGVLAAGSWTGWSQPFAVTITGVYGGSVPPGATNVQISLVITNVSIYAMSQTGESSTLAFRETTVGHTATSSSISLNMSGVVATPSNFALLAWNPVDYSVSGTTTSRSFNLLGNNNNSAAIDGFTVNGYVQLTYDAVPEPGAIALLGVGLGFGMLVLRHRRKALK